jgi:hypothetical protein
VEYYVVFQKGGEDAGWGCVVEVHIVGCEVLEGGAEVGPGWPGGGLEATFGEGMGIEGDLYGGRRGGREDFGA